MPLRRRMKLRRRPNTDARVAQRDRRRVERAYSGEYGNHWVSSGRRYNATVATESPVGVYEYLDYRAFLRDHYAAKKAASRAFSYRSFSKRAGVSSPNYLKLVIEGKRNLSGKMAERFALACGLDDDASR